MRRLSDYVEIAANEYLQEVGRDDLDARWIAAFFEECGVLDEHPRQDLIAFAALVQKALTLRPERARKRTRFHLERLTRRPRES